MPSLTRRLFRTICFCWYLPVLVLCSCAPTGQEPIGITSASGPGPANDVAATQAKETKNIGIDWGHAEPCTPETGWTHCLVMKDPKIKVQGSAPVSDFAMNAAVNIYTTMTQRLGPNYPKDKMDGLKIYITNGESHDELKALPVIKNMWTDGYGVGSRAFYRGGAYTHRAWISEQMICSYGVKTRRDDFAAGHEGTVNDTAWRSFDQLVHEFAHTIPRRFWMSERINTTYKGMWKPAEQFAQDIQVWFGVEHSGRDLGIGPRQALMEELFTSKTTFSCGDRE